ncbi:Threonylcarbamoyl-AMP synthase [Buchnera aphidicola (Eriosoma grossulariae)]|uniref:Sua5/YciO/YrdC/YwlC family protein n=1 Tax=Buchnera aphidicola TaxID=9 RepID=UPI003463C636
MKYSDDNYQCNIISLYDSLKQLRQNNVIAYPTESVFGLGCDPDNKSAVMKLIQLKNRCIKKGFILVAANYHQLKPYLLEDKISILHKKKFFSLWPGHTTLLLPAKHTIPYWLVGNSSLIAVRITNHSLLKKLCLNFGKPIISTSANITGSLPCRTKKDFFQQFGNKIQLLTGKLGVKKNPSNIINILTGEIIRHG